MPTEVIGDNTGDDHTGVIDTRMVMEAGSDDTNFDSTYIEIAKWNAGSDEIDSVIAFTGLSNITSPVTVSAATLGIYRTEGSGTSQDFDFHRCLRNWVETQATWNDYATATAWTSGGGRSDGNDRSATVSATLSSGTTNGYKTTSDAGLATVSEGWINATYSNYGLQGERNDGNGNSLYSRFTDSEGTDGQRPYLSVTYAAAGGGGRIMGSLANKGGLAGVGGIAGIGGGLAG